MRLRIECDGGSRGNPGLAGAGSSVVDPASAIKGEPKEVAVQWEYIPKATNNVAEYTSLVNGLTLATEVAAARGEDAGNLTVDVFMDSKLVVEQMSGRWKIKHPDMRPLAAKVKELEKTLAKVTYTWVPRAQNKRADELANRAMDDKESGQWAEEPEQGSAPAAPAAPEWHGGKRPTLLLLRHGRTAMSVAGQFSGLSDPELTPEGQRQAMAAANYLASRGGIGAVVASPLQRCQQTAHAAADAMGLDVTTHEGLIEMDFGTWEGKTFREIKSEYPDDHAACFHDSSAAPHGGESQDQVFQRIQGVVEELVETHAGSNVLVVSHVTPIKSILRQALGCDGQIYRSVHLDLAALSIVEFYPDGQAVVRLVNDTHFLR